MLEDTGFVEIKIGPPYDTFGEARGEKKARPFDVYGYTFLAHKPRKCLFQFHGGSGVRASANKFLNGRAILLVEHGGTTTPTVKDSTRDPLETLS